MFRDEFERALAHPIRSPIRYARPSDTLAHPIRSPNIEIAHPMRSPLCRAL
ncbi:MAG: hypothetical protein GDA43_20175 [Hormoscilla sp. SP5CHS1]|nr:hypothetical protein [Hormoscilla sp. SP5CHS1]